MAFSEQNFKRICGFFKNQDPKLYEQFLRAFDEHTHELTVAVTEATADNVLQAQGMAREARKLLRLFNEPVETNTSTP